MMSVSANHLQTVNSLTGIVKPSVLSDNNSESQQFTSGQNLSQLQAVVNQVQKSQNHDSSLEVKMSDPVITLYTSKNVQSPQKLVEQLAKEKGFMNSPIIIVENISKVTSASSMTTPTTSTSQSPPNLYVSMPTPESSAQTSQSSLLTSQEVHKCEECDYSSHNKHYLKQHVDLVHCASRPYKCPFCNYAGKRSHSLREHLMVHSNERPFVCTHCNATFRKKGHLTNHVKLHQKMVACPICKVSIYQPDVEPHMKSVHNVDKLYVCDVCSYMAVNKTEIEEHLKLHKTQCSQMYVCEMCNHRSKSFEHFCAHAETHRESIEAQKKAETVENMKNEPLQNIPIERKMMKCSECGFVSGDILKMKEHMLVHIEQEESGEKTPLISKDVAENIKQQPQTKTPEGKAEYKCVECEFSCSEAYVFVVHMLTHRPDLQIHTDKSLEYPEQSKLNQTQPQIMNEMVVQQKKLDQKLPMLPKTIKLQKIPKPTQDIDKIPIVNYQDEKQFDGKSEPSNPVTNETNQGSESLPFVYNTSNAKFRCTICGYTCDYQRTIKAHIWKHSGNKDIDYPMFQNGPLSIYEEILLPPGVEGEKPMVATAVPSAESQGGNLPMYNTKTVVFEKAQEINKMSSVSPVAPFLANMLAMRAKQKDTNGESDNLPSFNQSSSTSDSIQEILIPTQTSSGTTVISVFLDTVNTYEKGITSVPQNQAEKVVFMLPDQGLMSSKVTTGQFAPSSVQTIGVADCQESETYINQTEVIQQNIEVETVTLRRQPENLETRKIYSTDDRKNVVVESVDNTNLISYTSIKSQQNSPRAVSEVSQSELSDSGVGSDTNTVIASTLDKLIIETLPRSEEDLKESTIFQDFGTEVTVSSVEYDKLEEVIDTDDETSSNESDMEIVQEEENTRKRKRIPSTSMTESAVTLLSLLKKGPNENPACPTSLKSEFSPSDTNIETETEDKPKQGISSSLLAVIEQLRERSKTEAELEEVPGVKKTSKKRMKRELLEDLTEIENMGNVERMEEEGEVRYRCKLCHYSNLSTFVIKQHMRLHKTKQPFECSLCDFIATSSESLQDHMIQHCKVRTYQCKLCTSAFNYKSQLRAHMRAHTEKEVFVCDDCDYETTNPVSYRNHVRGHNEKKQYKCEVCDRKFISKYELKNHKKQLCSYQKSFQCDECDFVAIGPQEQKQHAKIHNKEFKCAKCEYNTTSITRFENHAKIHDEPKTLKCELCDFPAVSNRSLKSHMKRHINDQRFVQQPLEQYKCNICGYVCHHLPSLKSHMWRHASDQNYSYEFTNEVINAAIDYDSRLDTFECQKDDIRAFFQTIRQKLKDRLEGMNAANVDPQSAACWVTFRCCQCGFETINKAELNVHMKSHSDIIKWTLQVNDKQKKEKL